jgi:hypothetical protein
LKKVVMVEKSWTIKTSTTLTTFTTLTTTPVTKTNSRNQIVNTLTKYDHALLFMFYMSAVGDIYHRENGLVCIEYHINTVFLDTGHYTRHIGCQ